MPEHTATDITTDVLEIHPALLDPQSDRMAAARDASRRQTQARFLLGAPILGLPAVVIFVALDMPLSPHWWAFGYLPTLAFTLFALLSASRVHSADERAHFNATQFRAIVHDLLLDGHDEHTVRQAARAAEGDAGQLQSIARTLQLLQPH